MLKTPSLILTSSTAPAPAPTPVSGEVYNILTSNLGLLVTLAGAAAYKWIIEPKYAEFRRSLTRTLELEQQISGLLYRMLEVSSADRVLLSLPSNGEVFNMGLHKWRISDYKEATRNGVTSVRETFKDVPVGEALGLLAKLAQEGQLVTVNIADLDLTKRLRNYYTDGAVVSTAHSYMGKSEEMVGFIALHYLDAKEAEFLQSQLACIKPLVAELNSLLTRDKTSFGNIVSFMLGRKV